MGSELLTGKHPCALEDTRVDFAGRAVVISHDCNCIHMLAFEGEAHVQWFEDQEADKIRAPGPNAAEPKRIKHKKFAR